MDSVDGQPIHFGRPGCLRRPDRSIPEGFGESRVFAPSEDRNSPLWKSIEDGLKLFGFKESEVINVVRIPIAVQAVRDGVRMLPLEDSGSLATPWWNRNWSNKAYIDAIEDGKIYLVPRNGVEYQEVAGWRRTCQIRAGPTTGSVTRPHAFVTVAGDAAT
ncbi:hypothetical protein VTK56DRAFT_3521 [Thermocarpiscus australiensis]